MLFKNYKLSFKKSLLCCNFVADQEVPMSGSPDKLSHSYKHTYGSNNSINSEEVEGVC